MTANFRSDNETPIASPIMDAILEANQGTAWAYAEDNWSMALDAAFAEVFEREVRVLPVPTGTVANSIALACVTPPWGSVFCHRNSHIYNDESGAPEFYGHGLRLVPVDGPDGKITTAGLREAIADSAGHGVHSFQPSALSVTQLTESGSVYSPGELSELFALASDNDLATHLDGARFGNAVASLGCSAADLSWRAGAQMMSFGASKNGCMAAEALVFFDHFDLLETAERLRKRGGHLFSKMRYISCQLLAYVQNGLWLELAARANRHAARFADAVETHPEARLEFPPGGNEVFVNWTPEGFERLRAADIEFLMWPGRDDLARFVFGHSTSENDTVRLLTALDA